MPANERAKQIQKKIGHLYFDGIFVGVGYA
jgi:hypothetical protein